MKNIVIIDYQLSNLKSVEYACHEIGLKTIISSDPVIISKADALILPGVGAFADAMNTLDKLALSSLIIKKVQQQTPFMGVCLGLQLLFSESEEFGQHLGLDLIKGKVKRFPAKNSNGEKIRVPQIAWNQLETANQNWTNTPFKHLESGDFAYFVHSYYVIPDDKQVVLTTTNYNNFEYCSSVLKENIFATQFHPEKSGNKGLQIYKNWAIQNNLL